MNSKTLSLIALILAITFPLAGFIVGLLALSKANKEGGDGKGLAIAAVAIGSLWVLLALFIIVMIFAGGIGYFMVPKPS